MRALLFLSVFFLGRALYAQPEAELETQWKNFHQRWPQTQLKVILNQTDFVPGDTVWLAIYFMDTDNRLIDGIQWVNVDLWNSSGEIIAHQVVELKGGWGANQISLPASLPEGFYRLTAHSSWMKNFGTSHFFEQEIRVLHRQELGAQNPWRTVMVAGGPLVADLPAEVLIHSTARQSSISLVNAKNEVVSATTTDSLGQATLTFTPQLQSYHLVVSTDTTRYFLPAVKPEGVRVDVSAVDSFNQTLAVRVSNTRAEALSLTLAATCGSQVVSMHRMAVLHGEPEVRTVSVRNLPAGMLTLSLLQGDSLVAFNHVHWTGNRSVVSFQTHKSSYAPREKVDLSVALHDGSGKAVDARLSVRVINESLFPRQQHTSSAQQMVGPPPWQWMKDRSTAQPAFGFTNVLERRGVARYSETGKVLPDFTQVQFYLQKSKLRYRTFTYDSGRISFALPGVTGRDELFYVAQLKDKELPARIDWDQEAPSPFHASALKKLDDENAYARFARNRMLTEQAFTNPELPAPSERTSALADFETRVATADVMVDIADFVQFETMEELVKEVIPSLFVRTRKDERQVRVVLPGPMEPARYAPIFIVDGYATKDVDFFLGLKPAEVAKIGVVYNPRKLVPLGMLGANGLVLVETKSGNRVGPSKDQSRQVVGVNPAGMFDNSLDPLPEGVPVFRSTLIWLPQVQVANGQVDFSFYLSDDVTTWGVYVEGVSDRGEWFSGYHQIVVSSGN